MIEKYTNLTPEQFRIITEKYLAFQGRLNEVDNEPVKVFSPLPEKILKELDLIREVSKELQKKKEDDVKKAAAQASNQEENEEDQAAKTEEEKKQD